MICTQEDEVGERAGTLNQNREYLYILLLSLCRFEPMVSKLCSTNLSIENLGYDDNGQFVMEQQLEPLLIQAETYAKEKGYRNLKYIIGSTEMSCHGKPILDFAAALKDLKSYNRKHFDYFVDYGFKPTGFIPNCYGNNYHGIVMIKQL